MRVISKRVLRQFWMKHPDSERSLRSWHEEVVKAHWESPIDVTTQHSGARAIGNNRALFHIKGNDYRLVVAIRYDKGLVFIRFVGTHAEYDKINALTI